ncbi:MAG: adenosylcobinamide-GDP ribazoletransferase, partial [Paracoccaceae bacterium]
PNARGSGLSAGLGRPLPGTSLAACVVALVVAALALGPVAAGIAALATMAGAGTVAAIARVKIGGQTGDILGASQQISEIAVLAVLVALI